MSRETSEMLDSLRPSLRGARIHSDRGISGKRPGRGFLEVVEFPKPLAEMAYNPETGNLYLRPLAQKSPSPDKSVKREG
jgi:hypothetical protein